MAVDYCATAERLLARVHEAHAALMLRTGADDVTRRGLRALYDALAAGLVELTDAQVLAQPSLNEWSMAEVLDHVAEHDGNYAELARLGIHHYVEHGLEHALQLWRLRAAPSSNHDGAAPESNPLAPFPTGQAET